MKRKKQIPNRVEPTQKKSFIDKYQFAGINQRLTSSNEETWRKAFLLLFAFVAVSMSILSFETGINGDEDVQVPYAERLIDFYTSFGKDTSAFQSTKGDMIRYYGGGYEIIAALTTRSFGLTDQQPFYHKIRHFIVALFGIAGIFFIGRTAHLLGGYRLAFFAALFMFFSLRFTGEALWNNKDIPFATGYITATYFMILLLQELPKISWKTMAGLAIGIGIATSIRAAGILLIAYLGLFLFLHLLFYAGGIKAIFKKKVFLRYFKAGIFPSLFGFLLAILLWPYALLHPFKHIPEALSTFSQFPVTIRELFDGRQVLSSDIPWNYLITWIGITTPLYFLLGILLFLPLVTFIFKKYNPLLVSLIAFAFIFPIIYVMQRESPLYQGWRHFYFVYGAGIMVAVIVWDVVYRKIEHIKAAKFAIIGVLALFMLDPAVQFARNLTMPHMYFNPLIGGPAGAYAKYEFDYQGITTRHAFDWLKSQGIIHDNMTDTIVITSNFQYAVDRYVPTHLKDNVQVIFNRYGKRYESNWDYGIFVNRYMEGSYLERAWPGSKSVHDVKFNGVPVTTIYHNTSDRPFRAAKATNEGNLAEAVRLLEMEVQQYPNDALLAQMLMKAQHMIGNNPQALALMEKCLKMEPLNLSCLNFGAFYYNQIGDFEKGEYYAREGLRSFNKNPMAYYQLALVELNRKNLNQASQYAELAMQLNPGDRNVYLLIAEIFDRKGMPDRANQFREAAQNL